MKSLIHQTKTSVVFVVVEVRAVEEGLVERGGDGDGDGGVCVRGIEGRWRYCRQVRMC